MQVGQVQLGHVGAIGHHHIVLHRLQRGRELRHQRRKAHIEKQHLVFRVVDDVVDLLWEQTRVDRVQHRPAARHAVIQRQMPVGVPSQCAHPVPGLHAQDLHGLRHLP